MAQLFTINFGPISEILDSGIRRADVFMGVGLNASEQVPPISHVLSRDTGPGVILVKEELSDQERSDVANEFGKWVRANGIRELLETFSVYLTEIYNVVFMVETAYGDGTKRTMAVSRFERLGINDQIEELRRFIPISDERRDILKSLNQARNCYAHRRGLIGAPDIDPGTNHFELQWLRLRYQILLEDGTVIPEEKVVGAYLEKEGVLQIQPVIERHRYSHGDELVIPKDELKHLCLCVHIIGQSIGEETVNFALASGATNIGEPLRPEARAISAQDP
ncbi:hypothetical protein CO663_33860 [Rhizobium anhuiense]|uniref:hypothetical protein n=1 Tax=Rhizobium anhuiense TaxID=1184720 RepID=UPI000BE7993C|nr:hypothetical protein [Rhizobium anhuiense]PDS54676.1 hypothetical protein CO663_33860 [Rhizobium anhuiense]